MKRQNRFTVPKKVRKSSRANYVNRLPSPAPAKIPLLDDGFFKRLLGI